MNNFANTIFTVLFGWVRSLAQGIWNAIAQGRLSSFFTWLGDYWLFVLIVLCLGCTVLDYLVWLLRWRPYLVWRTRVRRFFRGLRGRDEQFHQGYEEGVALEMEEEASPPPAWEAAQEWQQPAPAQQEYAPAWQEEAQVAAQQEEMGHSRRYFMQPEGYEPPPVHTPSRLDAAYSSDMPAARRRRRSEKYERRKRPWDRLNVAHEDEETMLDGLPPAVDREQAFREPVYPQHDYQQYNTWKRPNQPTNGSET